MRNIKLHGKEATLRRKGRLEFSEIEETRLFWVRREQENYYSKELEMLSNQLEIGDSSPISRFNPYLAEDGVIKLSGRLDRSLIPKDQRNPILLPDVSLLAKLLSRCT